MELWAWQTLLHPVPNVEFKKLEPLSLSLKFYFSPLSLVSPFLGGGGVEERVGDGELERWCMGGKRRKGFSLVLPSLSIYLILKQDMVIISTYASFSLFCVHLHTHDVHKTSLETLLKHTE